MPVSIHTDMKSMKKAIIQEKNPKSIPLWSNLFERPIANVSIKMQYEITST